MSVEFTSERGSVCIRRVSGGTAKPPYVKQVFLERNSANEINVSTRHRDLVASSK